MTKRLATLAVALCIAGAATHDARAQARHPMTLIELAQLPRLIGPQPSPDGKTLAYFVSTTDWKTNRLIYHLWRQPIGGGAAQQLTFTESGDVPYARWSPDGRTLLFGRDGQFWLLPMDGGEAQPLTKHATSVSSPTWSPDGTVVYFLASEPRTAEERDRDRLRDDVYAFDENVKQRHLWKIVVSTGAETPITSGDWTVGEYKLSADGSRIVFGHAPSPRDADTIRSEVWMMDASGEHQRALTNNAIWEHDFAISPDNSRVLFIADTNEKFEPYDQDALFVLPVDGGAPRPAIPGTTYAIDQATFTADSRSIVATLNMGVHSEFFEVDVTSGRPRQITDGAHYVPGGWSLVGDTLIFQLDEPTRFGDVWTLPLRGAPSSSPARVTRLFDALERDVDLPRQQKVEWKGEDGATIEGVLFYPSGYQPGTRYPLVVQLHGGPRESDKFGAGPGLLMNYFPVLTARGYAVLRPNYRGSIGYGSAFFRDVVNGYFHHMAGDVLAGVDHLVSTGLADPDHLVVMGFSAGGTLVDKLVTMTDRFKAASSGAGVADWTSLWAQTDNTGFRRTWFGGTPWQPNAPIDLFWNNSPVKDAWRVKTPTLLFAGDADTRVPLAQSIEMYRALKSHDVPTHLYVGPREGHGWSDPRHNLLKANVELEWFEKYARGRTYEWEKAPDAIPARPAS